MKRERRSAKQQIIMNRFISLGGLLFLETLDLIMVGMMMMMIMMENDDYDMSCRFRILLVFIFICTYISFCGEVLCRCFWSRREWSSGHMLMM